ncbi:hypothetical protein HOLleu_19308 [Holothuria leucospilota]|uniref:Uncharacterized protein n=1 Tax=Holothuria leucospilota TaxID=206669 RepID=A0A9Q1BZ56_HOLLE|nr:hypothetical protein HOLleu_19308 [Holothuria leucospilota]
MLFMNLLQMMREIGVCLATCNANILHTYVRPMVTLRLESVMTKYASAWLGLPTRFEADVHRCI